MNNKLTRKVIVEKYPERLIRIKIISSFSQEYPDSAWWYANCVGQVFNVSECVEERFKRTFQLASWLSFYNYSDFYFLEDINATDIKGSIILKRHCIKI